MKLKSLLFIAVLSITFFSCGGDDSTDSEDNFDHAAQALIDDADLIEYLQTHYLNEDDNAIWTITNNETPLMDNVEEQTVVKDDINYKLYVLKQVEGAGVSPKSSDSVLVTYAGMLLDSTVFDSSSNRVWFSLTSFIEGWAYGFTNFKAGTKMVNPDESFDYENSGEGYLFIPSGLAYRNSVQSVIAENSPLIFKVTLKDVNASDHDNDTILSSDEDIDGDGNVKNDDTDEDGIPNYLDDDDDGDGILTKDELGDENNNGIADYLEVSE